MRSCMLLRSKPGFTSQSVHSLRSIKQRLVVPKIMFGNYSLIWFWPNPCRWGQTWMPLPSHFLPFSPLRYPSACRQLACLAEQQQFWAVPQPSRFGLYVQSMWTHGWQQVFLLNFIVCCGTTAPPAWSALSLLHVFPHGVAEFQVFDYA